MVVIMLIFSIIALIVSLIGIIWHISLSDILDKTTYQVEYLDYLLSGCLTYLLTPASIVGIVICSCLLFIS